MPLPASGTAFTLLSCFSPLVHVFILLCSLSFLIPYQRTNFKRGAPTNFSFHLSPGTCDEVWNGQKDELHSTVQPFSTCWIILAQKCLTFVLHHILYYIFSLQNKCGLEMSPFPDLDEIDLRSVANTGPYDTYKAEHWLIVVSVCDTRCY